MIIILIIIIIAPKAPAHVNPSVWQKLKFTSFLQYF